MSEPVKFPLGRIVATHEIAASIPESGIMELVRRHARNEWGDLCDEDKAVNDEAVKNGNVP